MKVRHDDAVTYGDRLKAPKLLADLVESIAAAIFVDCGCDLKEFWLVSNTTLYMHFIFMVVVFMM